MTAYTDNIVELLKNLDKQGKLLIRSKSENEVTVINDIEVDSNGNIIIEVCL